ncbi:ExbD/TolR family protein [Pseudooceanicola sediminis]|nr:biopolymer transporter ExbD [Pseudooceanicola sediminis]|tara:strand:+ start:107240 stop:107632 length:393 start_codon:yes stop_codon:yes gene_type:complete
MAMTFSDPPRRPRGESIVPMINVVFLLLIFFLMTSRLTPPEPFPVTPPTASEGAEADDTTTLYLSSEGEAGLRDLRGAAAIEAFVAENRGRDGIAQLRADATTEAAAVARALRELTEAGLADVALVVAPQ